MRAARARRLFDSLSSIGTRTGPQRAGAQCVAARSDGTILERYDFDYS